MHEPRFNQGGQADYYSFARDTIQNGTAEATIYNSKVVNIMHEISQVVLFYLAGNVICKISECL